MKALRVLIGGWVTSFRYPAFISGFQPTLPVPPLSTIYGLISAAKGELVTPEDLSVGYIFNHQGRAVDLETIYELSGLNGKSNVVKREFLVDPEIYLYVDDLDYQDYFKTPHYPLLLGRSTDLVTIKEIKEVKLEKESNIKLGKTILPLGTDGAFGTIQALPTHFTDTIPRKAVGTKPFILMNQFFDYPNECHCDKEKGWGVWFHK
ncbi:type I-B CRISPR-associated protein Cas5b [Methanobacterium petrolearium]|uniref:type I-B CRISPR-associated protein Cas5b n=1 Tax=Methanobacterium petrolearium TaxID=710190 RepID=UPI001AE34A9E|nr:type I-B CRISPR-associated protein Cas5b [Methanobacterium petrolearium]MBP1946367.1 CRISPR-associated protein Cas5t [Methanobacterium petrolearium]BDZ70613.1 type I-B CRISPR-associated protein Cas5 [Methanobacterium petrolearium]